MSNKAVMCLMCAILLGGCAHPVKQMEQRPSAVTFVDVKLRDAAEAISMDMAELNGSAQNRDAVSVNGSGDLYTKMSMTWDGPIDGALRKVASTAGFRFIVEGQEPETPVMAHVRLEERPCLAVLREIGLQTGAREGIMVDEASRTITLKYSGENK